MKTNQNPMKTSQIDKRFILTAILILAADAFLLVVLYFLFGKEITSMIGAFLTMVCVGIYTKFPKLRFEQVAESRKTIIPVQKFSWYSLFVSLCIFLGSQVACSIFMGVIGSIWMVLKVLNPHATDIYMVSGVVDGPMFVTGPNPHSTDPSLSDVFRWVLTPPFIYYVKVAIYISYIIGGYILGKTMRTGVYRYAVIGSFLFAFLSTAVGVVTAGGLFAFAGLRWVPIQLGRPVISQLGIHWFFFVWLSWVGARMAISQSPAALPMKPRNKFQRDSKHSAHH